MIWFGCVLCYINDCQLFNAKSSLYIYIKYIWFGLGRFYSISTIAGYLMSNRLHTSILNKYNLVWLDFMAYQLPNQLCQILFIHIYQIYMIWFGWVLRHIYDCGLSNAEFYSYIYIKYMICKHILWIHTVKWSVLFLTIFSAISNNSI